MSAWRTLQKSNKGSNNIPFFRVNVHVLEKIACLQQCKLFSARLRIINCIAYIGMHIMNSADIIYNYISGSFITTTCTKLLNIVTINQCGVSLCKQNVFTQTASKIGYNNNIRCILFVSTIYYVSL